MSDGTAWCWGASTEGQLGGAQPVAVSSNVPLRIASASGDVLRDVDAIDTGAMHTCALLADKTVRCWGSNQYGSLGGGLPMGAGMRSVDPVPVITATGMLSNVTRLAVGYFFACALVESSAVYCWGTNGRGQLGDASLADSAVARQVPLVAGTITALSAGGEHACAVVSGQTYCWGRQGAGRLGNGQLTDGAIATPQRVAWTTNLEPIPDVTKLGVSNRHACAVKQPPSEFFCWGQNTEGRLGDNSTMDRAIATRVVGTAGDDNRLISAGDRHTCATIGSDTYCWGIDTDGQLGNGDSDTAPKLVPERVITNDLQREVSAGFDHTCALGADRKLRCWGANHDGQLGIGDTAARGAPTEIASTAFCPR